MAWTAPMTFTPTSTLTAAQLNTYLRDNMLQTAPALSDYEGAYFTSTGVNSISERIPAIMNTATASTTTSTAYTDLASGVGPAVDVTATVASSKVLVFIRSRMENSLANMGTYSSWEMSGATVRASIDDTAIRLDGVAAANFVRIGSVDMYQGLAVGTTTFTMKHKVLGGTGTFADRAICVIPL